MGNIVVYADGTWQNKSDAKGLSNIALMHEFAGNINSDNDQQNTHYIEGVGNSGLFIGRLTGGGLGAGLDEDIREGYRFIAENYKDGDQIFIFGFSRGAYTARSLAGFIKAVGLLDLTNSSANSISRKLKVREAYSRYRKRNETPGQLVNDTIRQDVKIRFLGVFDTVGSLGIPDEAGILQRLERNDKYRFHDTLLSSHVMTARHAVAIDEIRRTFTPTLWDPNSPVDDMQQVWFPGVHSNVGGGYEIRDLSDVTLKWMLDEATTAGLKITKEPVLNPNPKGRLENSYSGGFAKLQSRPRAISNFKSSNDVLPLHETAITRHRETAAAEDAYWPTIHLDVGDKATVDIHADQRFNKTGVFLEKNATYEFSAVGDWYDFRTAHSADGATQNTRQFGHRIGDLWSAFESRLSRNKNRTSTYSVSKRFVDAPWFALTGMVANANGIDPETDDPAEHQQFLIGANLGGFSPKDDGYLYCFANDAWHFYFNNSGKIELEITRTA